MQEPSAPTVPEEWDALRPGRLQRRADTQETACVRVGTVNAAIVYHGPYMRFGGRVWDSVFVTVTGASSPVMTLQPQIVGPDGLVYDVGTLISLSGRVFTAGVGVRCHNEVRLNRKVPPDSTLLLKVAYTSGSLTNAQFHFVTTGQ